MSLRILDPVPMPWGIPVVGLLSLGWLLGRLASAQIIEQFALVGMMGVFVWILLGTSITWRLRMPLVLLLFAVPFGEGLVGPLQDYTAAFTVKALEVTGLPVYWEGRVLTIPSGTWQVVESCSGIRYLLASVVFGFVYADITYRSWFRRIMFMICSAVVPILANGFRAYLIVMIGHLSNNRLAVGVDHLIYGWVFFGLVMGVMGWVGDYWREDISHSSAATSPRLSAPQSYAKLWGPVVCVLASLVLAAGGPVWATIASMPSIPATAVKLDVTLTGAVSLPWQQAEAELMRDIWRVGSQNADAEIQRTYSDGQNSVGIYVAWYSQQRGDAEAVSSRNMVLDNDRSYFTAEETRAVRIDGMPVTVHEVLIRTSSGPSAVWMSYWVDGTFTANPYYAKLLQVMTQLRGSSSQGAVIAIVSAYRGDPTEARLSMQQFLDATSVVTIFPSSAHD